MVRLWRSWCHGYTHPDQLGNLQEVTKEMENKERQNNLFAYPPHWIRFYKGEDGRTYMQMEAQTDIDIPEDPEAAKEFGRETAKEMGFPHSDTMVMFNGKVLYIDLGAPNQYETQLVERSQQYAPPTEK